MNWCLWITSIDVWTHSVAYLHIHSIFFQDFRVRDPFLWFVFLPWDFVKDDEKNAWIYRLDRHTDNEGIRTYGTVKVTKALGLLYAKNGYRKIVVRSILGVFNIPSHFEPPWAVAKGTFCKVICACGVYCIYSYDSLLYPGDGLNVVVEKDDDGRVYTLLPRYFGHIKFHKPPKSAESKNSVSRSSKSSSPESSDESSRSSKSQTTQKSKNQKRKKPSSRSTESKTTKKQKSSHTGGSTQIWDGSRITKTRDSSRLRGGGSHLAEVKRGSRPLVVWTLLYSSSSVLSKRCCEDNKPGDSRFKWSKCWIWCKCVELEKHSELHPHSLIILKLWHSTARNTKLYIYQKSLPARQLSAIQLRIGLWYKQKESNSRYRASRTWHTAPWINHHLSFV